MGRELMRKKLKKEGKKIEKEEIVIENPIKKLVITIGVLLLTFTLIYLISALFITKELDWFSKDKDEETSDTSSANAILASSIFKQNDEEYYVYFYDFNEKNSAITNTVNYIQSNTVYIVNTSDAMNAKYVSDTSNRDATSLDELQVIPGTLIKITGDTITEYYEKNEILDKFN